MAEQRRRTSKPDYATENPQYYPPPPQYYQQAPAPAPQQSAPPPNYTPPPQPQYSLSQILGAGVTVISLVGGMFGTYVTLINKITEQQTAYALTTSQTTKELDELRILLKDLRNDTNTKDKDLITKIEFSQAQSNGNIDKLASKVEDIGSSVDSLFNRLSTKNNKNE